MAAVARVLGCALVAYLAAWIVGFMSLVRNWALVGDYFVSSWAGGGERPAFIQLFALIAGALGGVFGVLWHLYRRSQSGQRRAQ